MQSVVVWLPPVRPSPLSPLHASMEKRRNLINSSAEEEMRQQAEHAIIFIFFSFFFNIIYIFFFIFRKMIWRWRRQSVICSLDGLLSCRQFSLGRCQRCVPPAAATHTIREESSWTTSPSRSPAHVIVSHLHLHFSPVRVFFSVVHSRLYI